MREHADMLEWLADRLVYQYGERSNMDFILAARRMALEIRRELADQAAADEPVTAEARNG